ncbi:CDP-alcohol phosphatidyltransferase family protein [bacterium]|nr:CDP-alcohol phosphatidyltransferase family protein [bacterium]
MDFSVAIHNGKNLPYNLNEKLLGLTILERQIKIAEMTLGAKEVITVDENTTRDFSGKWIFVNGAFFIHPLAVQQQYLESGEDRFEKGGMFGFCDAEKYKDEIAEFLKNGVFPEKISTFTGPGYRVVVDAPEKRKVLTKALFNAMRKPVDGIIARSLNKAVSFFLTEHFFIPLHFTPNMVTITAVITGILSGFVALGGTYWHLVTATFLAQFASILDGSDGETARLTFRMSKFGKWLDSVGDSFVNTSLSLGLGYGLARYFAANPYQSAIQSYLETWPIWIAWLCTAINWYHNFVSYFDVIVVRKTTDIFAFVFWFEKKERVRTVDLSKPVYGKISFFELLKYFSRRDFYLFAYFVLAVISPAALLFGYIITALFLIPVFVMTTIHIYFGIIKKMRQV